MGKKTRVAKQLQPVQQNSVYEIIKTIFFAAIIAMAVRSIIFEPFSIPSGSMVPNLLVKDYLFVSKYSYGYSKYSFPLGLLPIEKRINAKPVARGDIVVFAKPHNENISYIKRVMGLPGDTIQVRKGRVYINGKILKREFIGDYNFPAPDCSTEKHKRYKETLPEGVVQTIIECSDQQSLDNTPEFRVPDKHYFMMGDNRDHSQDSRVQEEVGFVPYINIVGRAERIFFSLDENIPTWAVWKWPSAIRYDRLFQEIK
jgi:signal peptidase I